MSGQIKIRARVFRRFEVHPKGFDLAMNPWLATVYLNGKPEFHRQQDAGSHPEAMQAAYKLMADLDAELMNEVHASRATRRAERASQTITEYIENGYRDLQEATA